MDKIIVKADKRSDSGKGSARSLRRNGFIPAVVYSAGNSMPVQIKRKQMTNLIFSGAGENSLISIEINEDGSKTSEHPVLVKDYQLEPVSDELLHVDFMEISLKEIVKVTVPILIIKQPAGIKMGGVLAKRMREIEVECLPTQIPDKIEIDAGFIEIGDSYHVSDIPEQEGLEIITDPSEVILSVSAAIIEEVEPVEGAEDAAAEPELVKGKGKEEPDKEEKKEGK